MTTLVIGLSPSRHSAALATAAALADREDSQLCSKFDQLCSSLNVDFSLRTDASSQFKYVNRYNIWNFRVLGYAIFLCQVCSPPICVGRGTSSLARMCTRTRSAPCFSSLKFFTCSSFTLGCFYEVTYIVISLNFLMIFYKYRLKRN